MKKQWVYFLIGALLAGAACWFLLRKTNQATPLDPLFAKQAQRIEDVMDKTDSLLLLAAEMQALNSDAAESLDSLNTVFQGTMGDVKRYNQQTRNEVRELVKQRQRHEPELQKIIELSTKFKEVEK